MWYFLCLNFINYHYFSYFKYFNYYYAKASEFKNLKINYSFNYYLFLNFIIINYLLFII